VSLVKHFKLRSFTIFKYEIDTNIIHVEGAIADKFYCTTHVVLY